MKVKWFGQAAFLFVSETGLRIIADPYDPAIGYGDIADAADVVTISHEHRDHNYIAGVGGKPQVLRGPGLQEAKGIQFKGISTFHDKSQGGERGSNTVFCFSLDGVRVCHLGDLGHLLSDEQIRDIGEVDLLLIPRRACHHQCGGGQRTYRQNEATGCRSHAFQDGKGWTTLC